MGALLEHSSDAIILTRPDGTIQQVNPAFKRMFGGEDQLPTGKPISALFDAEQLPQITKTFHEVVEKREDRQIDVTAGHNGSRLSASAALSPIQSGSGQPSGVLCSLRDNTAHKRLETQLRQMLSREMELSELRSRLISMVSHELRTPLASIQLADEFLVAYEHQLSVQQKHDKLAQIKASVKQMSDLIEDILAFSRTESGRLKLELSYFDLVELCQMTIENIQASVKQPRTFKFTHHETCSDVCLDQRLLKLIIANLISNAVKYSPPNGTVYLDLRCENHQTVLVVRDEGIGIPPQDQMRLFEPFFRAQNVGMVTGTGLGLVIVKQAVEMHGGTIHFESRAGQGTTFTLNFPQPDPIAITRPIRGHAAAR
jgi:PAS domain S-box-containing protein